MKKESLKIIALSWVSELANLFPEKIVRLLNGFLRILN